MQVAGGGGGAKFYSGACVYANEYESRAQPTQSGCSVSDCEWLRPCFCECLTFLEIVSDQVQCFGQLDLKENPRMCVKSSHIQNFTSPK